MSLLSIVQDACRQLSLPVLASVVGNTTDSTAQLFLRLADEEVRSLANRHNWQAITKENTFTTTAQAVQVTASAIPTDFDRMVNESIFNRTTRERVWGPLSNEEWQYTQANLITLVDPSYRIRGNTILITPTPATGQTIAYEYISKNVLRDNTGAEVVGGYAADTNTSALDERLHSLGLVWRYRQAKGFVFDADQLEYERRVVDAIMRDGTRPRLSGDPISRQRVPRAPQTPDTLVF
jgi:hypothetical protein